MTGTINFIKNNKYTGKPQIEITDELLDKLGFTSYHNEAGDFGSRKLKEKNSDGTWNTIYTVYDMDENSDPWTGVPLPQHFCDESWSTIRYLDELQVAFKEKTGRELVLPG